MLSHLLRLENEDELISALSVGIQVVKYCIKIKQNQNDLFLC